jgi:hypothetical protein
MGSKKDEKDVSDDEREELADHESAEEGDESHFHIHRM